MESARTLLSPRAYARASRAESWTEIWEAGPYYARLSRLLEDASEYAIVAGWQIDSRLPMPAPGGGTERLREKIVRLCEAKPGFHFYFLMWDHAYLYVLERERWQRRIWKNAHPRARFVFDNRHPFGGAHHEKLVIVDGRVALCGGVDLCDGRWDSPEHLHDDPRRSLDGRRETHGPYHDMAVEVRGPVCTELHRHLALRWRASGAEGFPPPRAPEPLLSSEDPERGGHRVYLSRTAAPPAGACRPLVREIEFLFRELVGAARERLVLEGQYYWSAELNDLLMAKLRRMAWSRRPGEKPFTLVMILARLETTRSLTRKMAARELRLLERLQECARATGTRLVVGTPYVGDPSRDGKAVYVHSKTLIVDDRFLSIGSANFATRALRTDTELQLTLEATSHEERAHIRGLAARMLDHWGLGGESTGSLRPFLPARELAALAPTTRWIPWELFFDPRIPWLLPLRYRVARYLRSRAAPRAWAAAAVCLPGFALGLAALPGGLPPERRMAGAATAALLSCAWLAPVPFLATALAAAIALGAGPASRLAGLGAAVSLLAAYAAARAFPALALRRLGPRARRARARLRQGSLRALLLAPRLSLREKAAIQGIAFVPLPRFLLASAVLCLACFAATRLLGAAVEKLLPPLARAPPACRARDLCLHPLQARPQAARFFSTLTRSVPWAPRFWCGASPPFRPISAMCARSLLTESPPFFPILS
jgi:phosphatidylserine/phosphatidylglycerophosphate/cardiolipin synthase-like enzyme